MSDDVNRLDTLCNESDFISVKKSDKEHFKLRLRCRGLAEIEGRLRYTVYHRAELYMPADYPLVPPVVEWLTPLFHPNILGSDHPYHPGATCLGPWSPSIHLDILAEHLADMISYRTYNISSPLNTYAAQWTMMNPNRIPIDRRPIRRCATDIFK